LEKVQLKILSLQQNQDHLLEKYHQPEQEEEKKSKVGRGKG